MAELEGILVSNSYGIIGRELEAEATIKCLANSKLDQCLVYSNDHALDSVNNIPDRCPYHNNTSLSF